MTVDAFYLPPWLSVGTETIVQRFGPAHDSMEYRFPEVTPAAIARWIDGLKRARAERLLPRSGASIVQVLERVAERHLDRDDPSRHTAVDLLARSGRFTAPMIERALDDTFEPLARGGIRKWVESELGSLAALDRPMPGPDRVARRAHGPEWMLQIYAGNVPTIPVWPLVSALLLKAALFAKTSAEEPLFAPLLARTIAEEDEDLGACMAVVWWKGGTGDLDQAALGVARAVLAFGGEAATGSIARRARPDARLVLHGPKVSVGYVGKRALTPTAIPKLAERAALDVALYDQQGCLSPHAYYVERGGPRAPVDFAVALGKALHEASTTLPRRRPSHAEAARVQMVRSHALFAAASASALPGSAGGAAGEPPLLAPATGTDWTVLTENGARFEPGPTHRVIRVHSIGGPEEFEAAVAPHARYVEAVALEEEGPRRAVLASRLAALGIPRVASLGALQRPSPLDTHGGVQRLLPFVTWTTVDGPAAKRGRPRSSASRSSGGGSRRASPSRRRSR
ncbi:MAG: acyl-CoA reductase [Hyphomicrobiales bacterium]